ncbi:ComEC/Rec2 family competence protein [Mesorhizobium sp. SB112]|uniref:ComEC/Rec2 family competence protein n=1 Tax=Mesorhizobium sp. SB112 TaxID=3151853 RepID=UPI0032672D70
MAGKSSVGDVSERSLLASVMSDASPVLLDTAPDYNTTQPYALVDERPIDRSKPTGPVEKLRIFGTGLSKAFNVEIDRGTAFVLIPVFLGLGIILYFAMPGEPAAWPVFLAPICLLPFVLFLRSMPTLRLLMFAVFLVSSGIALAKLETWRAQTKVLGSEISTNLTGSVVSIERMSSGRVRLTLDVLETSRPTLRYAPDRARVSARTVPDAIRIGSSVAGYVRLMPPSGPVRPNSYDFSFESYFDGIGASGFFLSEPKLMPESAGSFSIWNAAENARNAIADRIRKKIGGPEGEIAAALVVGVRAGIPEEINEAMRRTGIYHVISISGLHMALVAGTIMVALRTIFAFFPSFSSRRPVKKYSAFIALFSIASYLFISGGEVAAQRSFIMLAVMLIAVMFDRAALSMRNLAISAMIVIAISPHEVVGPSFQMSFAATAALIGAYAAWSDYRSRRRGSPPERSPSAFRFISRQAVVFLVGLAATSIIAGLATTVYGAFHFQRVSPLTLAANLAAMPFVSAIVMPFGVIAAVAMPFNLDGPFLYIMGWGLTMMIEISVWFSERSPIDAVGLIPIFSVLAITIALVFATMMTTRIRLLAIPFAVAGVLTLPAAQTPDILISEDGRLVGVVLENERLAINRAKPNAFTIDNWKRALNAENLMAPISKQKNSTAEDQSLKKDPHSTASDRGSNGLAQFAGKPFDCSNSACVSTHRSGALIAHVSDSKAAQPFCEKAAVIVIEDATAQYPCSDDGPLIVGKRELAQYGSAAIFLGKSYDDLVGETPRPRAVLQFAISKPYRPWHTQRAFSREARGLAPYQRPDNSKRRNLSPGTKSSPGSVID